MSTDFSAMHSARGSNPRPGPATVRPSSSGTVRKRNTKSAAALSVTTATALEQSHVTPSSTRRKPATPGGYSTSSGRALNSPLGKTAVHDDAYSEPLLGPAATWTREFIEQQAAEKRAQLQQEIDEAAVRVDEVMAALKLELKPDGCATPRLDGTLPAAASSDLSLSVSQLDESFLSTSRPVPVTSALAPIEEVALSRTAVSALLKVATARMDERKFALQSATERLENTMGKARDERKRARETKRKLLLDLRLRSIVPDHAGPAVPGVSSLPSTSRRYQKYLKEIESTSSESPAKSSASEFVTAVVGMSQAEQTAKAFLGEVDRLSNAAVGDESDNDKNDGLEDDR